MLFKLFVFQKEKIIYFFGNIIKKKSIYILLLYSRLDTIMDTRSPGPYLACHQCDNKYVSSGGSLMNNIAIIRGTGWPAQKIVGSSMMKTKGCYDTIIFSAIQQYLIYNVALNAYFRFNTLFINVHD